MMLTFVSVKGLAEKYVSYYDQFAAISGLYNIFLFTPSSLPLYSTGASLQHNSERNGNSSLSAPFVLFSYNHKDK